MGRIKTRFVKASGEKIFDKGAEEFTESFDGNKAIVDKYAKVPSKRMRNQVVGHIVRLAKKRAAEED